MRGKATLQQAMDTPETLDQLRGHLKKLEKHLKLAQHHIITIQKLLDGFEPARKR
jgi:hypothetical protein